MTTKREPIDIEAALLDPAAIFGRPEDVTERDDIPDAVKIDILRRWEYDAKELEVAEEENMPDGEPSLLRRIIEQLHALGARPDIEHSPPTKQGGV